jgi:hypothetical protein
MSTQATEFAPKYFAVPDPAGPDQMTYWFRSQRGRAGDRFQPWPPRRRYYWPLPLDLPDRDLDPIGWRAAIDAHLGRVRGYEATVFATIESDSDGCAARFAAFHSRCCCCGKALTDERSKVYSIGPECRQGLPAELLAHLGDLTRHAHGKSLVGNGDAACM